MTVTPADLDEVHEYWFGTLDAPEAKAPEKAKLWFERNDETDRTIRERFGWAIADAAALEWNLGALSRREQIGLVVLLDQFPRNIYRTTGQAFAYDPRARGIAGALMALGIDRFYLAERLFLFLPSMHSEAIADQDRCVLLVAEQALAVPEDWKENLRQALDFATKHRDLIRRFGRFPHRNEMLGRESTDAEKAFLAAHGRGF